MYELHGRMYELHGYMNELHGHMYELQGRLRGIMSYELWMQYWRPQPLKGKLRMQN